MSRRECIAQAAKLCELEFYRFKRYQTPFSIALICFEEALPEGVEEVLRSAIRRTDLIEEITHCSLLIIFGHTDRKEADRAMIHLHRLLEQQGTRYHVGLAAGQSEDAQIEAVITRAVAHMQGAASCLEC